MDTTLLLLTAAQVAAADDDGLTWREIIADLPHDPTSLVILGLLAFSILLVVRGSGRRDSNRRRPKRAG